MLPSHRAKHRIIWIILAACLPLILLVATIVRPAPFENAVVKSEPSPAGSR